MRVILLTMLLQLQRLYNQMRWVDDQSYIVNKHFNERSYGLIKGIILELVEKDSGKP